MLPFEPYGGTLSGPHNFFFVSLVDLKVEPILLLQLIYLRKKVPIAIPTRF
jgi:hypothetical protein